MLQRPPPSGLLGWLSDLSSSRSSPARRGRRFTLRYGDGRASVVRVVWRHDGEDEEGEGDAVEANVTLRFRAGEEGDEDLPPSGIVLGSFSGSEKSIEVELRAKLIGSPGDDSGGSAFPLPMDDAKTHVLTVREHPRFLGAVDSYSLTRLVDDDCTVTTITTTPASARAAARSATAPPTQPPAETTDGPPRKARKEATKRKDGEESAASPKGGSKKSPNKKTNGESTKKDKKGAANEAEDRPKRPPNGYMMFSMERRREEENLSRKSTAKEIAEMYHALADEERKKYNDDAREAMEKFKKEHPDLSKSVRTKRKKKADVEVENMAEAGDEGKKAAEEGDEKEGSAGSAKMREEEQEDGPTEAKVKVKDAKDRPKRPPNGYIRFSMEVRGKVVEEHPEWKVGEVAKRVGEMYRALTDEERTKYNDAAREAMERFKEEHPDLPKSPPKKRKKKEEEEAKLVETEATATAGKKGAEEKEKGEAKSMGSEAQKATEGGEEKERKAGSPKKRGKGEEDKANGSAIEVPREKEAGTKKEGSGKKKSKQGEETETLSKVDSEKKKRKKKKKGDAGEDNAKDKSKAKKEKVRSSKKKKKKDDSKERRKSKEEEIEEEEDSPPKGNADDISPTNTDAGEEGTETGRPKRPLNAYMRFANERRSQMMVDHPGARQSEITKLLGEVYRSLDDEEKQPYKDAAAAALAKFKKEHGDEVRTYDTKKRKKQRKEDEARGAKSGDDGDKRPSKRVRSSSISSHHARGGYDHIPPEPATGLPEGWILRKVPRAKVEGIKDHYYFSPGSSYRFRSMTEVGRFRACVDRANGDETRGIELYLAEKPERSKRGGGESGKKEKVGVAVGGNEGA
ncbi:hypothetical protein ACHAWF_015380 [Thalassiosira exigua]